MSRLSGVGVGVEIGPGWEGVIDGGGFTELSSGAVRPTVLHVATVPLSPDRGSFGSGVVETLSTDDILIVLFDYGPESADTPLFEARGLPRPLQADDFSRDNLQHGVPGQSGAQRFFTDAGRGFCLYVVLGSHIDRADLLSRVNEVLATIDIV